MTTGQAKRDYISIVSGLPRSGTSMVMNAIAAGGIEPLIDQIRGADEDNPRGYYEFEPVKKTKEDDSWLNDAVGKVVKMVYRLLYDLPGGYQYRVVFTQRNLQEVLASQTKMLSRNGRADASIPDEKIQSLFAAELEKCETWLAEQANFQVLYISHRDMIDNGQDQARKMNDFLGGDLNVEAMGDVVDPDLYRNRIQ
jgi:hypothetical protein